MYITTSDGMGPEADEEEDEEWDQLFLLLSGIANEDLNAGSIRSSEPALSFVEVFRVGVFEKSAEFLTLDGKVEFVERKWMHCNATTRVNEAL